MTTQHEHGAIAALRVLAASILSFVIVGAAVEARAEYPDKPVHVVIGVAPGGGTDTLARLIAGKLSEKWGQSVVVENKPSNLSVLATEYLSHAAPDGYTLMVASSDHTIAPGSLQLSYDPIKDFVPITLLATVPNVLLVNPAETPVKTLPELIATVKEQPGKFNFGSAGGAPLLETQLLMKRTGIEMVQVNYKGASPTLVALLGGEVQLAFGSVIAALEHVKAGKLTALGVSTATRAPLMPDVPTVAEAANLPGFDISQWYGLIAPAGVPQAVIDKVNRDVVDVINAPEMQETLLKQGFVPAAGPASAFADRIASEIPEFTALQQSAK